MKYLSRKNQVFLAIGAALIALTPPPALHAQASVSYQQQGGQSNGSSRSVQVSPSGGQPGSSSTSVTLHPTGGGGGQGPVVYIAPPVIVRSAPTPVTPPAWGGPGYNPGGYYGQPYPRMPYGSSVYTPPYTGPITTNQMQMRPPIFIPDAAPTAIRARPPAPVTSIPPHSVNVYVAPPQRIDSSVQDGHHHHDDPDFLGGFYFGNYVDGFDGAGSYQSAYSLYPGVPAYIFDPNGGVVVIAPPVSSPYVGGYIPFDPSDIANYGIENLYRYEELATVDNPFLYHGPAVLPNPYAPQTPPPSQQQQEQQAPAPANQDQQPSASEDQQPAPAIQKPVVPQYQAGSYKEAFADIESAWINGDIDSIRKHLRNNDLKVAVSLNGKYSYSIASGDWADITRDALDHLQTVSFQFTLLRFQKSGDITGYAKHVYMTESKDGDKQNTMYLSYTLRHRDNMWYVVSVDTSPDPLIPEQKNQPASDDQSSPAKPDKADTGSDSEN